MNPSTNPFSKYADAKLTEGERARMRARLMAAMHGAPDSVIVSRPVASPYASLFSFGSTVLSSRGAYAFAALVLIIGISGSTAFAAEGSVPGDILYGVKIGVNEPVALALAATPEAKAQAHTAIAVERLSEASTLISNGTLTASASDMLATSFIENASDVAAIAASVATTDPNIASALRTSLSNQVATRATALLADGDRSGGSGRVAAGNLVSRALANAIGDTSDAGYDGQEVAVASTSDIASAVRQRSVTEEQRGSSTTSLAIAVSASAQPMPMSAPAPAERSAMLALATSAPSEGPEAPQATMATVEPARDFVPKAAALPDAVPILSSIQRVAAPPALADLTSAIDAAEAHFNAASSTLDASSTAYAANALANARLISLKVQADASVGDSDAGRHDLTRGLASIARLESFLVLDSSHAE